jgi:DNA-binding protein HU-beta
MFSAFVRRASASPSPASWVRGFASKPPGAGALGKAWAIELIKDAAGVTNKQAEASYKALLEGVASSVAKGERVTFQGFGTFEKTSRAARAGVNPQTGAAIQIPATFAPKFKAGAAFKQLVKGK